MNTYIIIGSVLIVLGALTYEQFRSKSDFTAWLFSFFFLAGCLFFGSLLTVGGIVNFVEVELRGKTVGQCEREYDEIITRSKQAKIAQKKRDKIFFDSLISEVNNLF